MSKAIGEGIAAIAPGKPFVMQVELEEDNEPVPTEQEIKEDCAVARAQLQKFGDELQKLKEKVMQTWMWLRSRGFVGYVTRHENSVYEVQSKLP